MMRVTFATGNKRKIQEAAQTLQLFDIDVESVAVDIHEIQHHDPAVIAKTKVRAAYEAINRPVVASDTSWEIPALGGFPGGYMKDIAIWLQTEDWLAIMNRHADKRIICIEHVAYCDGERVEHFEQRYEGQFVNQPRGRRQDDESFESIVVLYGEQTMAEQLEQGDLASAGDELGHWLQFGEWYSKEAKGTA